MTVPALMPQSGSFDDCVVIEGVSYETYRRLSKDIGDRPVPRLAFQKGFLRIMSPSSRHETLAQLFGEIVRICSRGTKRKVIGSGSATLDKKDKRVGAQPDVSYYIANVSRIRKKTT